MSQAPARDFSNLGTLLSWGFDRTETVTSFVITKSTDKGQSFSALATVTFDVGGAAFEKKTARFFYTDATLAAGDIYRLTVVGPGGTSQPEFLIVPPTLQLCHVFGYVFDAFGAPSKADVNVEAYAPAGMGFWTVATTGVAAHDSTALALAPRSAVVSVDAAGLWRVALLRRCHARIVIAELGIDYAFEVPDREGPINLRDIPRLRQADAHGQWNDESKTKAPTLIG